MYEILDQVFTIPGLLVFLPLPLPPSLPPPLFLSSIKEGKKAGSCEDAARSQERSSQNVKEST